MGIRKYTANQDTTITNAFKSNLKTRGTGSNMGSSDILEVFSIYGQSSATSSEASRILVQFPINSILSDRNLSKIPSSGSVNFYLRLFNAPHGETLPNQFTLLVNPISKSFQEGNGLDMEEYTDITRNGDGANWINSSSGTLWNIPGGDFISSSYSQYFDQGIEDLELDITPIVESWISNNIPNYGLGIYLTNTQETQNRSFYTKRFFARTSEFFFKRPIIEARWNSSVTDDRQRFFVSSSLLSQQDNTHTIYFYNYVNGQLKNVPSIGTGQVSVLVYSSASDGVVLNSTPSPITGGYVSTGIYSASFILDTTASIAYDIWYNGAQVYHTGTLKPIKFDALDDNSFSAKYVSTLTNLKNKYSTNETSRLRLFTRLRDWNPNIFTVASNDIQGVVPENIYYKLLRTTDNNVIIDYGTGSLNHTKLSYDGNGNFFDFDFNLLEPNYSYGFKFLILSNGQYEEQDNIWKFRIT